MNMENLKDKLNNLPVGEFIELGHVTYEKIDNDKFTSELKWFNFTSDELVELYNDIY